MVQLFSLGQMTTWHLQWRCSLHSLSQHIHYPLIPAPGYYWRSMKMTASHVYCCVCFEKFISHERKWFRYMAWIQETLPACIRYTCFCTSMCLLTSVCVRVTIADTMKYPMWSKGVNSNSTGWPFCCGVTHLWLQGMANGCWPCSMFSIGSIQHLSTQGCILIYPPVLLPLPACRAQQHSPLSAIVIRLGSVKAKLRTEQHEQEWNSRRQQLRRQSYTDSDPALSLP